MKSLQQSQRIKDLEVMILLALFCLVVNFITHWQAFFHGAIILLAAALFIPYMARKIAREWLKFAIHIGQFNNKVILTAVFFFFLTPIALLYRRFARNPLMLKPEDGAHSCYHERNHTYGKRDFEKMW